MDDLGDIIKTKIFKDLGYDPKTTKYNIPVYAHPPQSNANDHIADVRKMVAAAPGGWKLVPIEPTSAMLDAGVAMALQVSVHGQGGWSKYIAALYAQLLKAAPQASAEQPKKNGITQVMRDIQSSECNHKDQTCMNCHTYKSAQDEGKV